MFSYKNKFAVDKPIQEIDFRKYRPASLATVNNAISNIFIDFPRGVSYICLENSDISVDFEVLKNNNTR